MKNKHKIWILIIGVVLIVALLSNYKSQNVENKNIKIGFVLPLTGFGAAWGVEQKQAMDLAVEEINSQGKTLGKIIEVIYEDGKCDAKTATIAAQKLVAIDHVNFLMSACSAEALATARIADENKINLIAAWATNPQISGISKYVFRNSYSDEDTARIIAEDMNKKYSSVGIITELGDYSSGVRQSFKKYYKGVLHDEDGMPHATDFRTQIQKIAVNNPQAIFINANESGSAIAILNQLEQIKYKGVLYGNYFGSIPEIQKISFAKGMLYPADPELPDNKKIKSLFSKYESRFGQPTFDFAISVTYDSAYILKKAIDDTNSIDSEAINDYLHALSNFEGVLGTYGFKENGDATGYQPSIKII